MEKISLTYFVINLIALVSSCRCIELSSEYISLPRVTENCVDDFMRELSQVRIKTDSTPEMVLKQLTQRLVEAKHSYADWGYMVLLSELLRLAEPAPKECPAGLAKFFLAVYIYQQNNPRLAPMQTYLDHYGSKKFDHCAWEAAAEIREEAVPKIESEFNEFYWRALSLAGKSPNDALLYSHLKGFDVTRDQMDLKKMADSSLYPLHLRLSSASVRILWFFSRKCEAFRAKFGRQLDMMNVAKMLNSQRDYFGNIRLVKLNEFNRICLDQQRRRAMLESNIRIKS